MPKSNRTTVVQQFSNFPVPYWSAQGALLYLGDVRDQLRRLPKRSVHCVITSPPYWALRDYGTGEWEGGRAECDHMRDFTSRMDRKKQLEGMGAGSQVARKLADFTYKDTCCKCGAKRTDMQIGAEPYPDCGTQGKSQCGACFVCSLVEVIREVYRVLRDDGTLWLNLGDTYASSTAKDIAHGNLIGIPWRVALALQADGWVLRSAMPWVKRNAMPDSAENRPGRAVEDVFLLTKGTDYFFNMEAIKPAGSSDMGGHAFGKKGAPAYRKYDRPIYKKRGFRSGDLLLLEDGGIEVFNVTTKSYSGAHYAVFPPDLIIPMILAGTSECGCCAECGKPYDPMVDKPGGNMPVGSAWVTPPGQTPQSNCKGRIKNDRYARDRSLPANRNGLNTTLYNHLGGAISDTIGWRKVCGCQTSEISPAIVLDPFVGSGTTVATAIQLGRFGIGIDLSETYLKENAIIRIEAAIRGENAPRKNTIVAPAYRLPPFQKLD